MSWKEKNIYIGEIKEKQKKEFSFISTRELDIQKVVSSCSDCTRIKEFTNTTIRVEFRANQISVYLRVVPGYQDFKKAVIVYYKDGSVDTLTFNGRIIK